MAVFPQYVYRSCHCLYLFRFAYPTYGGKTECEYFTEANKELTAIAPLVPEKFRVLGHQGWTAMPVTGSPQWYSLVTSLILGVGIGCLAQPQLVVRFMTVESSKQLNRGVFIGCFFLIITIGAIYHAGALSNLFFLKTEGAVATEYVYVQFAIPYDGGFRRFRYLWDVQTPFA